MKNNFKKSDLKNGMRVQMENGLYMYIDGKLVPFNNDMGAYSFFDVEYTEDFRPLKSAYYKVEKVLDIPIPKNYLNKDEYTITLWERKSEPTYTIDGIEYSESTLRNIIKKALS